MSCACAGSDGPSIFPSQSPLGTGADGGRLELEAANSMGKVAGWDQQPVDNPGAESWLKRRGFSPINAFRSVGQADALS